MYTHIFVAGTFDRLHVGHEAVLKAAMDNAEYVTIGITSDTFLHTYKPQIFSNSKAPESFEHRKNQVISYCKSIAKDQTIECVSIDDPYEPASSQSSYDALIVTQDNRKTGEEINGKRIQNKLPELTLVEVAMIDSVEGTPISSSRVRSGEIDREGNLLLPENLRPVLREPFGQVIPQERFQEAFHHDPEALLVTVGDLTTWNARQLGILPHLSVIDLQVERKPFKDLMAFDFPSEVPVKQITSGPGFIASEVWDPLHEWAQTFTPTVFHVVGEDDLFVLPIILSTPVNSIILYGQPNEGIVKVTVTESLKKEIHSLLLQFTSHTT